MTAPEKALMQLHTELSDTTSDILLENETDYKVFTNQFNRFKQFCLKHNKRTNAKINWRSFWVLTVAVILEDYYGVMVSFDVIVKYFQSGLRPNDACILILRKPEQLNFL